MDNKYIDDLREIKHMMSRSSRFSALSGSSGIMVGLTGLIAALLAYWFVLKDKKLLDSIGLRLEASELNLLLLIALGAIIASLGLIVFLTNLEIKKSPQYTLPQNTRQVLLSLGVPLIAGGIVSLIFLFRGFPGETIALTLVFYGLALINASKFTLPEVRTLGLIQLAMGIIALMLLQYSLIFWAGGFGLMHIIFGVIIQVRQKQ